MNFINTYKFSLLKSILVLILVTIISSASQAVNRVSVASGSFSNAACWSPAGVPSTADVVTIKNGHTITVDHDIQSGPVTINTGGTLNFALGKKLTMSGPLTVNGTAEIKNGDLTFTTAGAAFYMGPGATVIWEPLNNTATGATLFTNGTESFSPTSNLIINKWYNYSSVPLGSVVTGNFGNVTLNSFENGLLFEWNQNNYFENHKILGTLTIEQGWIVLDKTGSISNTTIGSLYLKNINSYLDIHSGNHPGSFTFHTGSITNIGGTMNGIYNGEGNINLVVDTDFTNLGYVELIYNSGVQGIGNGNASMQVGGKFKQTTGDFRGIFNISSTTAGKTDLQFHDVEVTGGIFMANYACHTNNENSTFHITGTLKLNLINANAKFRGAGLNSISGTFNNLKQDFIVDGEVSITGNAASEFTSSGSSADETATFKSNASIDGSVVNFNYGAHPIHLNFEKQLSITGGTTYFSKTTGSLFSEIGENLNISGGTLNVRVENGISSLIVHGSYNQSGGNVFLYNNVNTPATNIIYSQIEGNFSHTGGTFTFDNNNSGQIIHQVSLSGDNYTTGGTAVINNSKGGLLAGIVYFDKIGTINYFETGSGHSIQNIKQVISSGCTLKLMSGNIQVASHTASAKDMLRIAQGGVVDLRAGQLYSNQQFNYCGIKVDADGILKTARADGLYNGTPSAAINSTRNMNFSLDPNSVVEYNGTALQTVTGNGVGIASENENKYGILRISNSSATKLTSSGVSVRTGIDLLAGEFQLNGFNLTIESGKPSAIIKNQGYIKSENNSSTLTWQNLESGNHIIPFGYSSTDYLPVSFTPKGGNGNQIKVSTRSCNNDNRPLTTGVTNINMHGTDISKERVIDRWYKIDAPGLIADVTVSYRGAENTTLASLAKKNFAVMSWTGSQWTSPVGEGNGVTTGIATVTVKNMSTWGPWLLVSAEKLLQADILDFTAVLNNNQVDVNWQVNQNCHAKTFIVEKSSDGFTFNAFMEIVATESNGTTYSETDEQPLTGTSYYRLKQIDPDGTEKYSQVVTIDNRISSGAAFAISSTGPNPFHDHFKANFTMPSDGDVMVKLFSTSGQLIYSEKIEAKAGSNSYVFEGKESIPPGLYIFSLSYGTEIQNQKLFKY